MTKEIFQKIVDKEAPAFIVYEDEHVLAFLDIFPISKGHTLVIPKNYAKNIFDISQVDFQHIAMVAHKLAPKIKEAVGAQGVNLLHSAEKVAQQDVEWFHLHIIPRFDDGQKMSWNTKLDADKEMLESTKNSILSVSDHSI